MKKNILGLWLTGKALKTKSNLVGILIAALLCLNAIPAEASEILGRAVWHEGNSHEYVVVSFPGETWENAVTDLNTLIPGYHLATITSQEENDFVSNLMKSLGAYGEYSLGGFQDPIDEPVADKGWTWVTSEPWDYTNWSSGEPNDGGVPGLEQHLSMYGYGEWNDEGSAIGALSGYIAESPSEPLPTCNGKNVTILGTEDHDVIIGTNGPDVIHGLGGHDVIWAKGGDDVICGGDGNDTLGGGDGEDILLGEAGHDVLWGGDDDDVLRGFSGNDTLGGGAGNDILRGNFGNDSLYGDDGDDELYGGWGPNNGTINNNDTCYDEAGTFTRGCEVFYDQ